jgi:hypothetical protein
MLSALKKSLKTVVTLSVFALAAQANAADLLPLAKDLQPNVKGLPPAFVKPIKVSVCFFDMQGSTGEFYSRAKDLGLIARRWNIIADFKVIPEEAKVAESFKAGKCDAAVLSTLHAREFNKFMGSVDAVGGIPTYAHMRLLLKTLFDPKLERLTISEPYQIVSIFPVGAQYLHIKDRSIEQIEQLKGKKISVINWDNSLATAMNKVGFESVSSDVGGFTKPFNANEVDALIAPSMVYWPYELKQGLGDKGGIYSTPAVQMTASLVINREALKKKATDVDGLVSAFRSMTAQFHDEMLDKIFHTIERNEKEVPKKYWMILEPEHEKSYQEALTKARIALTKEGVYDVTMMKVLKKIRCKIEPNAPECSNNDE